MGFVSETIVGERGEPAVSTIYQQKEGKLNRAAPPGRDRLILEYLSIVTTIVQAMMYKLPPSVNAEDLFGAGVLGLIDAAERFDSKRAVRFRTYAELRVRGAILDYLRSLSWAPRVVHRKMREIDRARTSVERRESRSATLSDVAGEMGLPPHEVSALLVEAQRALMCPIEDLDEEQVALRLDGDPFEHLERKELLELIGDAIEELPERQKLLLWLYYYEQLTMKEAGLVLGVNEARTSQIHSKAISTLRESVKRRLAVDDAGTCDGQDIRLHRRPRRRVQKQSRPQAKDSQSETHGI